MIYSIEIIPDKTSRSISWPIVHHHEFQSGVFRDLKVQESEALQVDTEFGAHLTGKGLYDAYDTHVERQKTVERVEEEKKAKDSSHATIYGKGPTWKWEREQKRKRNVKGKRLAGWPLFA